MHALKRPHLPVVPPSGEQPLEIGLQGHFKANYNTVGALSLSYDNCLLYLRKQGSLARNSTEWLSLQHWSLPGFLLLSRGWVQLLPFEANCYLCLWLLLFLCRLHKSCHPSSAGHRSWTLSVFDPWHSVLWAASCCGLSQELSPPTPRLLLLLTEVLVESQRPAASFPWIWLFNSLAFEEGLLICYFLLLLNILRGNLSVTYICF